MKTSSAQSEFSEIRKLYSIASLAAEVLAESVKAGRKDEHAHVHLEQLAKERGTSAGVAKRVLRSGAHLAGLRAILFVRLVSVLEAYLIDTVRWLFLHRKDLFHKDETLELQYRELLAARSLNQLFGKLIERECRRLQNRGFAEMRKYFQKRFAIDFAMAGTPSVFPVLEEMHERRHLLVHRLGRTDDIYRRAYKTREARLSVPEDYLLSGLSGSRETCVLRPAGGPATVRGGGRQAPGPA